MGWSQAVKNIKKDIEEKGIKDKCDCGNKPNYMQPDGWTQTGFMVNGDPDCPIFKCDTCGQYVEG